MNKTEREQYAKLNDLSEKGGIVIFGCGEDKAIPACELCQAFAVNDKVHNRSFGELSIQNAVNAYKESVAPLDPETLFLHIGEADIDFFEENPAEFDNLYRKLILQVKKDNRKCRIAVVSLKNDENDSVIENMNKHLKFIAESEQCEYGDIANKRVWNPKAMRESVSFVYTIGFDHPLHIKRPLCDLVKILFCYDA